MLKHNQEHIISSQEMITCYYYCCYSFLPHAYRERASYVFFFFFFSSPECCEFPLLLYHMLASEITQGFYPRVFLWTV